MDRTLVSGTEDLGSTPSGSAILNIIFFFGEFQYLIIMKSMNLSSLDQLNEKLENHSIFSKINSIAQLVTFMEHHVFAVWDFMSLLKKLQFDLIPLGSPWIPNPNGNLVRFINEIVMEEESDQIHGSGDGLEFASHFEIYLKAMEEVGANTEVMTSFLSLVKSDGLEKAMQLSEIPNPSLNFMNHTFELIEKGNPHQIAASFALARESIVPLMFQRILDQSSLSSDEVPVFRYYLERHAHLDGEHHGPMSHRLLKTMCGGDPVKEFEVIEQAKLSLEARITFWDEVLASMPHSTVSEVLSSS